MAWTTRGAVTRSEWNLGLWTLLRCVMLRRATTSTGPATDLLSFQIFAGYHCSVGRMTAGTMASSQRLERQHDRHHPDEALQPHSIQPIHATRLLQKFDYALIFVIVVYVDFLHTTPGALRERHSHMYRIHRVAHSPLVCEPYVDACLEPLCDSNADFHA